MAHVWSGKNESTLRYMKGCGTKIFIQNCVLIIYIYIIYNICTKIKGVYIIYIYYIFLNLDYLHQYVYIIYTYIHIDSSNLSSEIFLAEVTMEKLLNVVGPSLPEHCSWLPYEIEQFNFFSCLGAKYSKKNSADPWRVSTPNCNHI